AEENLALAQRWGAPDTLGRALRTSGVVTSDLELLREAVAILEPTPAALEHAYALFELGAAFHTADRNDDARKTLRATVDEAITCGATALANRAETQLRAAGARPRTRKLTGADALTPTERRVAALAANGLSNRDIA